MGDDSLKVLALNGIKNVEPERAIPLLEGVLGDELARREEERALRAGLDEQSAESPPDSPQLRQGRGQSDCKSKRSAAGGEQRQGDRRRADAIYQATQDTDVKLAVIGALRLSGNGGPARYRRSRRLADGHPLVGAEPRGHARPGGDVHLYEKETNKELRLQIVSILGSMNATEQISG
jgi:hypothetical protein